MGNNQFGLDDLKRNRLSSGRHKDLDDLERHPHDTAVFQQSTVKGRLHKTIVDVS